MLVGAGALGATDEVIAVADRLSAGCAKALLGKAVLPDELPWVTGSIGLFGYRAKLQTDDGMRHAVDGRLGFSLFRVPAEGRRRARRADRHRRQHAVDPLSDGGWAGRRCRRNAARLAAAASAEAGRDWRKTIEKNVKDWWKTLEDRARQPAEPINPQRVAWELSPRLPERAIITSDSGSCANWFARDLKMRRGMKASLSGGLASMGAAVPYAIAAKYADPDRPVIALVGDGAMQMNNMAELITVAKYWRQWQDHRWIVCVFNNEDLNQVTWEQRIIKGDPKFEASQRIPNCFLSRASPK